MISIPFAAGPTYFPLLQHDFFPLGPLRQEYPPLFSFAHVLVCCPRPSTGLALVGLNPPNF